jgi:hypothetical protein
LIARLAVLHLALILAGFDTYVLVLLFSSSSVVIAVYYYLVALTGEVLRPVWIISKKVKSTMSGIMHP